MIRHHRLIELYLIEALGFPGMKCTANRSARTRHQRKAGRAHRGRTQQPQFDPHGDPIPSKEGTIEIIAARSLALVEAGQTVRVIRVRDDHKGVAALSGATRLAAGRRGDGHQR